MPDISRFFETLRDRARAHLPEKAFLKLDRGDALLITNADPVEPVPGFTVMKRGAHTVLSPDIETIASFEDQFDPRGELSRGLVRYRSFKPTADSIPLFSEGLKRLRLSSPSERQTYDKRARQYIAKSLREKQFGGLYAIALINDYLNTDMEECL